MEPDRMIELMELNPEAREQVKKIEEFHLKNGYKYTTISIREEGNFRRLEVTYSIKLKK